MAKTKAAMILELERKIKEQEQEIERLRKRLDEAEKKVYEIRVELPYTDYDGRDQSTPVYSRLLRTNDQDLMYIALKAIRGELDRVSYHGPAAWIDATPAMSASGDEFTTVEEAVAIVRADLLAHQSDSVRHDDAYWVSFGFDSDCIAEIACMDYIDYDEDPVAVLLGGHDPGHDGPFEEAFRAWARGAAEAEIRKLLGVTA